MLERLMDPRIRLAILGVLVVGVGGVLLAVGGPSIAGVRDAVDRAGMWGPVLFVVGYAVLVVGLVPGSPLTIAAGVLFGPWVGTALVVVGATLGATGGFVVGRRLGRDGVRSLAGERLQRVDEWIGDRGLVAVLSLRLVPIVPFSVSNYVLGVTGVRLSDFVVATAVGIVPGTFAYAALGGSFDDPLSPTFLGAVTLAAVLAVVTTVVDRRRRQRDSVPA